MNTKSLLLTQVACVKSDLLASPASSTQRMVCAFQN